VNQDLNPEVYECEAGVLPTKFKAFLTSAVGKDEWNFYLPALFWIQRASDITSPQLGGSLAVLSCWQREKFLSQIGIL
jgi:hypothetical protein